jgi:hypothetical protein
VSTHLLSTKSLAFSLLEGHVRNALIAQLKVEQAWEIQKVHFEDSWTPDPLLDEVVIAFGLQVGEVTAEFFDEEPDSDGLDEDEIEEDGDQDPEWRNLLGFEVIFHAQGKLAVVLNKHGCNLEIVASINNDAIGESAFLGSEEDVSNSVSLLSVSCTTSTDEVALHEDLTFVLGS